MNRSFITACMALSFVPLAFVLALATAGWFSRIWWRVLLEIWRRP